MQCFGGLHFSDYPAAEQTGQWLLQQVVVVVAVVVFETKFVI